MLPGQRPRGFCGTHGCGCPIGIEKKSPKITTMRVEAAGPTCQPFSFSGKRLKAGLPKPDNKDIDLF